MSRFEYDHFDLPSTSDHRRDDTRRCMACGTKLSKAASPLTAHCDACISQLEADMSESARQLWQQQKDHIR